MADPRVGAADFHYLADVLGNFGPSQGPFQFGTGFQPIYQSTAPPGWNANHPTSTEFVNMIGTDEGENGLVLFNVTTNQVNPPTPESKFGVIYYNQQVGLTTTFVRVPEPSTLALAGLGSLGLAISAYSRRRLAA